MIIGAFTGAVAGLGLEIAEGGSRRIARGVNSAAEAAVDRLPAAADKTKDLAANVGATVRENAPDIVESGKEAVRAASDKLDDLKKT